MKKLLFSCIALVTFCALGQVANAQYYRHDGYYHRRGYHHSHFGFYGSYGYAPFYGPPGIFFNTYYAPAPAYYCPPPPPPVYEGRIVREPEYRAPARNDDYSK